MRPRRQDSLLYSALVPPNPIALKAKDNERTVSALNNAIDTINIIRDLVPLELGRGVLSAVSGILGLVRSTVANQDDFTELVDQCHKISLLIWRATSGQEISPTILRALSELKESVDAIRETVDQKAKKGVASRVFHTVVNQDLVAGWQKELDRFLALFNTELNIAANLKLDELVAAFEEFRNNTKADTESVVPDALPVKPTIFFGREDLVRDTVKSLLASRHVALIGPGGMGKTSIARQVLNDDAISEKFSDRRYFVRYDDMDASQITYATFLDRIARSLGISPSKANTHSLISRALSTPEVLLILDNAETFLDAEKDAGRIADSIDEFGARANVAIMLTTRTTGLPPNLTWERLRVPALEEGAACAAFKMIYHRAIEPSILSKLLSSIDFHPLSINLLAQVAVQNDWSPEELVVAWDHQHALLLENGDGKIHSIAVTIELSLNSPSIKRLGDTVRHLLQVIAFLPQGISKMRLTKIFPSDLKVDRCAELLCKHSLAYYKEDFITTLAPIRLYISTQCNDASPVYIPLLSEVEAYYDARLHDDPIDATLIRSEDINIEHVVAHGLARCMKTTMYQALSLATLFVSSLTDYKPRATSLSSVVSALQLQDPSPKFGSCLNLWKTHGTSVLIEHGSCLYALGILAPGAGQFAEALELLEHGRDIFLICGSPGRLYVKMSYISIGEVYATLGNYVKAEQAYETGLRWRTHLLFKSRTERHMEAYLNRSLGSIKLVRGKPGAVELCLAGVGLLERVGDTQGAAHARRAAGFAEMMLGNHESARRYFDAALAGEKAEEYDEGPLMTLLRIADVTYRQGKTTECWEIHQRVLDIIKRSPNPYIPYAMESLCVVAAHRAMEGDVESARGLILPLMSKISQAKDIGSSIVMCYYLAGCIELRGNGLRAAAGLFAQTVEWCKAVSEVHVCAQALRALGEIAVLEKDFAGAKARFEEVKGFCDFMSIKPEFLHFGYACYTLSDTLTGWTLFQQGRLLSAPIPG